MICDPSSRRNVPPLTTTTTTAWARTTTTTARTTRTNCCSPCSSSQKSNNVALPIRKTIMSKRSISEGIEEDQKTRKLPCFPRAAQLADIFYQVDDGMIVRDNVAYLNAMAKLTLFTRPTQMGKSTLLSLAEKVYSKNETAPEIASEVIPEDQRNTGYVLRLNFLDFPSPTTLSTWQENLRRIDLEFLEYIKECVTDFLEFNPELKSYFVEPTGETHAGLYLRRLATAVKKKSKVNKTNEFFVVLVDEYDRPLRETLFRLLMHSAIKSTVTAYCPHYVSFFSACKSVGEMLPGNRVWVTGVVPIVLDLISGFKPENMTFVPEMSDALGLRDDDVDFMLDCVHRANPFETDQEKAQVRVAIQDHANHLQFLFGSSLYHTRMVNELMMLLLHPVRRKSWLRDLSVLPGGVSRERAPGAIYELLKSSKTCRKVAKDLVARKDICGALNVKLNLPDVATVDISKDNYLTLLVHLGIASVHEDDAGGGHIFRCTSRYFRSECLNELLSATLAPLFGLATVDEIYTRQYLLEEFMAMLPASGMSKMINWANGSTGNQLLELQFQGVLVGELHDHFIEDDAAVVPTQDDELDSGLRTDIQIKGKNTMLILELKQKPGVAAPPTALKMSEYHEQLHQYMEEVSEKERNLLVAGFVVVMYANGTKFQIERTTYDT